MTNNRHLTLLKQDVKAWNCWRQENRRIKLDLSGINLSNLNLSGVDLSGVNLSGVNFRRTNLKCAYLKGANLYQACLISADLSGSDLSKVDLTEADLTRAYLCYADLTNANLTQVIALKTNFKKSILTGACLEKWQIDSRTNLEELVCDYFYGKQQQHQRYPENEQQNFVPGESNQIIRNKFEDSNYMDAIVVADSHSQSSVSRLENEELFQGEFLRKGMDSDGEFVNEPIPQSNNQQTVEQSDNLGEESIDDIWKEESENSQPKLIDPSSSAVEQIKQKKDSITHLSIAFLLGILVTILTLGQIFKQASTSSNNFMDCDNILLKQAENALLIQDEESLKQAMQGLKDFNSPLGVFADEQCKQTLYKVKYVYAIQIKASKENNLPEALKILCELPEKFYQNKKHKPWFTHWANNSENPDFSQQLAEYLQANSCSAANYLN